MKNDRRASNAKYFKKWYREHKTELADKRRARYHSDPEYRAKAKANATRHRTPKPKRSFLPRNYDYTLPEVALILGVPAARVRLWLHKHYLPAAKFYHNRYIFTANQVDLMEKLYTFMETKATRLTVHSEEFENLRAYLVVNWK